MNTIYLFFLSFVFSINNNQFVSGFVSKISQTQIRAKTYLFNDNAHFENNHKNIIPTNSVTTKTEVGMKLIIENPLYIVIWKDCKECKELLHNMELLNVNHLYFNIDMTMSEDIETADFHGEDAEEQCRIVERQDSEKRVWKNLKDVQNRSESKFPIFYKDDVFLGNKLMDIYCELYPM